MITAIFILASVVAIATQQQVLFLQQQQNAYADNNSNKFKTVCFEGKVDVVHNSDVFGNGIDGTAINVNDTMTGHITYNLYSTTVIHKDHVRAVYIMNNYPDEVQLVINGIVFLTNPRNPTFGFEVVNNNQPGASDKMIRITASDIHILPPFNNTNMIAIDFTSTTNRAAAINDTRLPTTAPNLSAWNKSDWRIDNTTNGGLGGDIHGNFTNIIDC